MKFTMDAGARIGVLCALGLSWACQVSVTDNGAVFGGSSGADETTSTTTGTSDDGTSGDAGSEGTSGSEEDGSGTTGSGATDPGTSRGVSAGSSEDGAGSSGDDDTTTGVGPSSEDGESTTGIRPPEDAPDPMGTCAGQFYEHVEAVLEEPELHIVGVYESQAGSITVSVERPGVPMIVVLSSYESVEWTLDLAQGVDLQEVILNGYEPSSVQGHGNAVVQDRSGANYITACGYAWPGNNGGCDTPGLVSGAESLTGAALSSFSGCYAASSFAIQ